MPRRPCSSPALPRASGNRALGARRPDLFAPGLAQAGLPPDRIIYAECGRDEEVLAVMEEGLRHGGLAAVVGEVGPGCDGLHAPAPARGGGGGTTALMLKRWRRSGEDPSGAPSAAVTRWRIACVPPAALPCEESAARAGESSSPASAAVRLFT
jgi:protein ImuA